MPLCCGAIGGNGIRGVRSATITGRERNSRKDYRNLPVFAQNPGRFGLWIVRQTAAQTRTIAQRRSTPPSLLKEMLHGHQVRVPIVRESLTGQR